jgi:hypothetical protein
MDVYFWTVTGNFPLPQLVGLGIMAGGGHGILS